jgi:hypothetical protein
MIFHFKEKRRVKRQMEKELKFKFGVGEIVKVVDIGDTYSHYINWFKENGLADLLKVFVREGIPTANKKYKVVARGRHSWNGDVLYAIEDYKTKEVYLIGEKGLELAEKEENQRQYPKPAYDIIAEMIKMCIADPLKNPFLYPLQRKQPKSPYGDYTNFIKSKINLVVVNHKKKQVIIRWNDKTQTKATCNEKDDFDIKVGFAIAFTRKFFKNDKKLERYITLKRPKNNSKVVEKEESKPKIGFLDGLDE